MIRGIFHAGRPHVSGLLVFPGLCGLDDVPVNFVVDSGADRSLIAPSEYADYFSYADATRYRCAGGRAGTWRIQITYVRRL
jgi:hypothetical protein